MTTSKKDKLLPLESDIEHWAEIFCVCYVALLADQWDFLWAMQPWFDDYVDTENFPHLQAKVEEEEWFKWTSRARFTQDGEPQTLYFKLK